eukprot:sb/3463843/
MSDKEKYGATDESPIIEPPNDQGAAKESEDAMALHEVYEKLGLGWAQYISWTASFLIAYSDYAELTLIALIIPYIRCEWDLSSTFEATITISIFVVYAMSAMLCGKLADIFGRRTVMLITTLLLIVAAGGAALASNQWLFLFWRTITGICVGAKFSTIVVYSTEFCPNSYRTYGPVISIMGSYFSMFSVNLFGYFVLNAIGWRWLIIIITLPVIPAFILLLAFPESPRYLVVSNQQDRANSAIATMATLNGVELPAKFSVYCHQEAGELGSYGVLWKTKEYRIPAIALAAMYFFNILLETGVLVFLPLAFISSFCGGEAPKRDRCATLSQKDLLMLTVSAIGSLVGCVAAFFIASKVGRLRPLRVGSGVQIAIMALLFVCFGEFYLFGVATLIKIINAIVVMIIWIIIPESFPTIVRSTATGAINSSGKAKIFCVGFCVPLLFTSRMNHALLTTITLLGLFLCGSAFQAGQKTRFISETLIFWENVKIWVPSIANNSSIFWHSRRVRAVVRVWLGFGLGGIG